MNTMRGDKLNCFLLLAIKGRVTDQSNELSKLQVLPFGFVFQSMMNQSFEWIIIFSVLGFSRPGVLFSLLMNQIIMHIYGRLHRDGFN